MSFTSILTQRQPNTMTLITNVITSSTISCLSDFPLYVYSLLWRLIQHCLRLYVPAILTNSWRIKWCVLMSSVSILTQRWPSTMMLVRTLLGHLQYLVFLWWRLPSLRFPSSLKVDLALFPPLCSWFSSEYSCIRRKVKTRGEEGLHY